MLATDDARAKVELYAEVYDPITSEWFAAMGRADHLVHDILTRAPVTGLHSTLLDLNRLFHALVDEVLPSSEPPRIARMLDVVRRLRRSVLWVEHSPPRLNANAENLLDALRNKMRRNISLGAVEALICLESAVRYGRQRLGLSGEPLADLLVRSRRLYTSLAVLHDDQEMQRLHFLAGVEGHLSYPDTDYDDVIAHRVIVGLDKIVEIGGGDTLRLGWLSDPVPPAAPDSPVMRCPAQRLRDAGSGRPFNDLLWDLLIEIYRRTGDLD